MAGPNPGPKPGPKGKKGPKGQTRTTTKSVAVTATFNYSESRKHNFDVSGAASVEATLVSVPAPTAFVDFVSNTLRGIGGEPAEPTVSLKLNEGLDDTVDYTLSDMEEMTRSELEDLNKANALGITFEPSKHDYHPDDKDDSTKKVAEKRSPKYAKALFDKAAEA